MPHPRPITGSLNAERPNPETPLAGTRPWPGNERLRSLIVLLLLCATAWTFREVVGFDALPLVDDDTNIFFNPHLSSPNGPALAWMFSNLDYVYRYMPLGWLGYSVVYAYSGFDPMGYHVANLALHALDAWLLFAATARLLRRFLPQEPERDRLLAAGAAALLWAVHPLRNESVSTCSGLLYSQALFFALVAVHARFSEHEARARGAGTGPWLALGFATYSASVLTYPVALFLAPALLVLDIAWVGGFRGRGLLPGFVAWGLVAAGSVALNIKARFTSPAFLLPGSLHEFGILQRALQACRVYAVYVLKSLWPPSISRIPDTIIFDIDPRAWSWWLAAAAVAALSVGAWALRRRAPCLFVGWLMYLLLLVPNLGLMEHPHTVANRYTYLPACVLSAVLAFMLLRLRPGIRPAAWAACLVIGGALAQLATREARVWRNTRDYLESVLSASRIEEVRQITVSRLAFLQFLGGDVRGGRKIAYEELARAPGTGGVLLVWEHMEPKQPLSPEVAARPLQEWPAPPWAVAHLITAQTQLLQARTEDALLHLDQALALDPDYGDARFRRGLVLADAGRMGAVHDWLVFHGNARAKDRARDAFLASRVRLLYEARGLPVPPLIAEKK